MSAAYRFKDMSALHALLGQHAQAVHDLNVVRVAEKRPLINFDYPRALDLMRKRVLEFYIGTSRHFPHQGKRECARRRRQMAAAAERERLIAEIWHSAAGEIERFVSAENQP